jgi:hypothetical protein
MSHGPVAGGPDSVAPDSESPLASEPPLDAVPLLELEVELEVEPEVPLEEEPLLASTPSWPPELPGPLEVVAFDAVPPLDPVLPELVVPLSGELPEFVEEQALAAARVLRVSAAKGTQCCRRRRRSTPRRTPATASAPAGFCPPLGSKEHPELAEDPIALTASDEPPPPPLEPVLDDPVPFDKPVPAS